MNSGTYGLVSSWYSQIKKKLILWLAIPKLKIPSHKWCPFFFLTSIIAFERIAKKIVSDRRAARIPFHCYIFWERSMWWPFIYEAFLKHAGCNLTPRSLYFYPPLTSHFFVLVYTASKKLNEKGLVTNKTKASLGSIKPQSLSMLWFVDIVPWVWSSVFRTFPDSHIVKPNWKQDGEPQCFTWLVYFLFLSLSLFLLVTFYFTIHGHHFSVFSHCSFSQAAFGLGKVPSSIQHLDLQPKLYWRVSSAYLILSGIIFSL